MRELDLVPYHALGFFTWDRERFPRLAVKDGRGVELIIRAGTNQMDVLAGLLGECYPAGMYTN